MKNNLPILIILLMAFAFMQEEYQTKQELIQENQLMAEKLAHYKERYILTDEILDIVLEHSYYEQDLVQIDRAIAKSIPYLINDPYSYLIEDSYENFKWYGLYVDIVDEHPTITRVSFGSAAEKAGLKASDKLLEVNNIDVSTASMDKLDVLFTMLDELTLKLETHSGHEKNVTLSREYFDEKNISSKLISPDIMYVKLYEFNEDMALSVMHLLNRHYDKGLKKVIIDLRNNPGGYIYEANLLLNYFIETDTLYYLEDNKGDKDLNGLKEMDRPLKNGLKRNFETVILINENTASASELFASSMRQYNKAILIGNKTYGKGVMQDYFWIEAHFDFYMTTHEMYAHEDSKFDTIGLEPDIHVETAQYITPEIDEALDKALEVLNSETTVNSLAK